jgi:hypothetical protein
MKPRILNGEESMITIIITQEKDKSMYTKILLIFIIFLLSSCSQITSEQYEMKSFFIKQNHGSTDALTEAYVAEYPALGDYLSSGAPPQKVVDWATSIAETPQYSSIIASSFASPSIFFADTSTCGPSDTPYPVNYIYNEDPSSEFVCYKVIDCSATMISPNILITAGHCPCIGFGLAHDSDLPIAVAPDGESDAARALFRSYTLLGIPSTTDYYNTFTHPWYFSDEYFFCKTIYTGWSGFTYSTSTGRPTCSDKSHDIAFLWCYDNENGESPGDKYGFVDYHVDFYNELKISNRKIISRGYPLPPRLPHEPMWVVPKVSEVNLYSIWQNPIYRFNYWNKYNSDPMYSYASTVWNSDNAWPICNYIHNYSWCELNISSPYDVWTDTGSRFTLNDYYLFYGHKLISEGISHYNNLIESSFPYIYTYYNDHYRIYKTHGGSGSPVFSIDGKLVSGPSLTAGVASEYDSENRGYEDLYYPMYWGDPSTRSKSNNLRWLLFGSNVSTETSPYVFDKDMDYIFDLIEGSDTGSIGNAYQNNKIKIRSTYYLPLHDWHTKRSIWNTDHYGSLLWEGYNKPIKYVALTKSAKRIPFGVVRSYENGRWTWVENPLPPPPSIRIYTPPPKERNLYTNTGFTQDVELEPNTLYGITVKYINTCNPSPDIIDYHHTYFELEGIPTSLPNTDEMIASFFTFFISTDSTLYHPIEFKREGYGQTLIEDIVMQKVEIIDGYRKKISYTFDNWDEREIWLTHNYPTISSEWKQSMFWNVKRDDEVGWAAVLLSTNEPRYSNNLSTFYAPLEREHDYLICADYSSTRIGPPGGHSDDTGVKIEILNANNLTMGASSNRIDKSQVGYIKSVTAGGDHYYYDWKHWCVDMHTHDIDADSFLLLFTRETTDAPHVLIDNLTIEEMPPD